MREESVVSSLFPGYRQVFDHGLAADNWKLNEN